MKQRGGREKRRDPRRALRFKFRGTELSLLEAPRQRRPPIRGEIQNVSAGGLCLLTDRPVEEFHLVRGEVLLPRVRVGIPALLHVRWRQQTKGSRYRVGLQFVL